VSRQPRELTTAEAAAREAVLVRALARHHLCSDPGFAADLMAAADRHEAKAAS